MCRITLVKNNYNIISIPTFCLYLLLTLPEHLSSPPVFSGVRVTRYLVLCVCFLNRCLSFCIFSSGHCVVCTFSIYGFWLPPFGIFKLFLFYWWCMILSVLIFAALFIGSRKSQFFFKWSINGKIVVRLFFLYLRWLDMYFWFYFLQWQSI